MIATYNEQVGITLRGVISRNSGYYSCEASLGESTEESEPFFLYVLCKEKLFFFLNAFDFFFCTEGANP
jgi:hypothetical protein